MKVFVTGGAGFIGSHLVDKLISQGDIVTVYDNLSSGRKEFLEQHMRNKKFTFIEGDLLDIECVKKNIKNHDVVFHIAANPFVRLGEKQTRLDLEQGAIATYNVLESMRLNGVKKIVFSSSSVVYGETPPISIPETYGPTLPISFYGAGKLAGEGLISAFCGTFGFQAWVFRFANVVGSRGTHGVIVDFIDKLKRNPRELEILGDGKQRKPYLHVSDIVDGMIYGFEHSNEQVNLFNLGCDSNTTVTHIAEMVVEEMGLKDVKFKYTGGKRGWPGDVPRFQLDTTRMKKLGWKPRYTSDEAVRKAIREILDNPITKN
ncbi:MAG: UDP-glucose 4-epimerase [Thermoplasmata archaeon]|nr:MAG: UDP-glucose 4-epimerase [Thermoplasmata archaeon]RLF37320.1 MAG: UDP-glucose 4-epimerase [Thermoplasmata archaeon]RLF53564.1 MAG: UDP-glucose 4-epimerase [Thermoplasmata archaeon]